MNKSNCPCHLPCPSEEVLATIPGTTPDTALRVRVETTHGYVRLEQMAYSSTLGWYSQKSFCVPAALLESLVPELRKAQCLTPSHRTAESDESGPLPFNPAATGNDGFQPTRLRKA